MRDLSLRNRAQNENIIQINRAKDGACTPTHTELGPLSFSTSVLLFLILHGYVDRKLRTDC